MHVFNWALPHQNQLGERNNPGKQLTELRGWMHKAYYFH
jgi:hypothetical protein